MTGLQNLDAERSILGAILLDPQHLATLLVDEHLRPDHFSDPTNTAIYQAAIDLSNTGRAIDWLTLSARLRDAGMLDQAGGEHAIEALTGWVPVSGHVREYGRIVRERHQARQLLNAAKQIEADVLARPARIEEILERAHQLIDDIARDGRHGRERHTFTAEQLQDWYFDDLGKPATETVWDTPFYELNDRLNGGFRRGEMTLIGGWGKHGKSVVTDQLLEAVANRGAKVHLYINEMTRRSRVDRMIARLADVPFKALKTRQLNEDQRKKVTDAMDQLKIGITECAGWTAPEIARHIKRNRWDACCVDIAHNIPKTEPGTAGADAIAHELRAASLQAETLMLVTVHLNNARSVGSQNPVPVARDIRDTGMWDRLADHVLFIYREEDKQGIPTAKGGLIASRLRDGDPGVVQLKFVASRMRFEVPSPSDEEWAGGSREFVVDGGRF